jgi:hypothetical protein
MPDHENSRLSTQNLEIEEGAKEQDYEEGVFNSWKNR